MRAPADLCPSEARTAPAALRIAAKLSEVVQTCRCSQKRSSFIDRGIGTEVAPRQTRLRPWSHIALLTAAFGNTVMVGMRNERASFSWRRCGPAFERHTNATFYVCESHFDLMQVVFGSHALIHARFKSRQSRHQERGSGRNRHNDWPGLGKSMHAGSMRLALCTDEAISLPHPGRCPDTGELRRISPDNQASK